MAQNSTRFRIVVGFDLSPLSELALREAAALAKERPDTDIHVLIVVDAINDGGVEYVEQRAAAALRACGVEEGPRICPHVLTGDPSREIIRMAEDVEADLIIVGTHGRRGIRRLFLGSVAEQVMRRASCPVLVMRPRHYEERPELEPEPACPECVAVREQTGGASWWCAVHDRPWQPAHRYSYQGSDVHPYHPDR
jgi:nucleotide-binding universal stress UspA family protein